ncbi:MAG TPA: M3 family metallopeptidase [Bryobacteraceae bacterium]|nr:M3 family metallopeptidase [Bryobacteraceae bacterium]
MTNPLLELAFEIPFDQIRAEHVEPGIDALLEEARARQQALAASTGPRTFENTIAALDDMTHGLDTAANVVRHLEDVTTTPELRAAWNRVQPRIAEFRSRIPLDAGLWRVLSEYAEAPEAKSLTGPRRRFLHKTLDIFRRHGAELDETGKQRLQEIDVELSRLTTKFAQNVLDSTNSWELVIAEEEKLAGLPPSARQAARESAAAKGLAGWRFTLQAPSYVPLMTYLDDRHTREQVYRAFVTRAAEGEHDNRPIITRILELRRAKAHLLGFRSFADFVLADRMAHTGAQAQAFLERLRERTEARFREENEELLAFRRSLEGSAAPPLAPWDTAYYAEKQRAALYDFDEEALRPYFPLERVLHGVFSTFERLYGVRVTESHDMPVWSPGVRTYRILEADGVHLGSFYTDWFPRENKRNGAWMDGFITGQPAEHGWEPHLGFVCGNLTPPVSNRPALLTHREVETVFHEFGHLMHHLLSRVELRSMSGTNVAWDFVELPSQIMENWCWERDALDMFAAHYETGERLPDELFGKMRRARTFRAANAQMRQLGFGTVDLALHIEYSPDRDGDVIEYANRTLQRFSPAPLPEAHAMIASFMHLFASPVGYGSGYYSYKWAEVLEADAFTRFHTEGVFSREIGNAFRDCILSRGDSEDPAELYRAFMGRDPDESALLARSGLLTR